MVKHYLSSFLFVLFLGVVEVTGQDYYTPESPIVVDNNSFTVAAIKQKILEVRVTFKDKQINQLEEYIVKNNEVVDRHIRLLRRKASDLSEDIMLLEQIKTLKESQEQIQQLKKEKADLLNKITNEAAEIVYEGLFAVVFDNIDPYTSKETLAEKAELYLRVKAVQNLNERVSSGISNIEGNDELKAHFKSILDGKLQVEKVLVSKKIDSQTKYVYMAMLKVIPMINDTKAPLPEETAPLIVNLQQEIDYASKFYQIKVSESAVHMINEQYLSFDADVSAFNEEAFKKQRDIFSRANVDLAKINEEIAVKELEVDAQYRDMHEKIENKTRVKYDEENTSASVRQAIDELKEEIRNIKQMMLYVKEQELVGFYNVEVISNGDPAEDIGRTAVETFKKMQSYTSVEPFLSVESAENLVSESGPAGTSRKFHKLWIYPVAGDDDNFIITIVANFQFIELVNRENLKLEIPNIGETDGEGGKSSSKKSRK